MTYAAAIREAARAMRAKGKTLREIATALDSNRSTIFHLTWDIPHPNQRHGRQMKPCSAFGLCWQCGEAKSRWGRFCGPCNFARSHHSGRAAAGAEVAKAIRAGTLPHARNFQCTDCSRAAEEYDHRDYNKPLDVQPVCRKCNARRGPGIWVQFKPVRDLIAERQAA